MWGGVYPVPRPLRDCCLIMGRSVCRGGGCPGGTTARVYALSPHRGSPATRIPVVQLAEDPDPSPWPLIVVTTSRVGGFCQPRDAKPLTIPSQQRPALEQATALVNRTALPILRFSGPEKPPPPPQTHTHTRTHGRAGMERLLLPSPSHPTLRGATERPHVPCHAGASDDLPCPDRGPLAAVFSPPRPPPPPPPHCGATASAGPSSLVPPREWWPPSVAAAPRTPSPAINE